MGVDQHNVSKMLLSVDNLLYWEFLILLGVNVVALQLTSMCDAIFSATTPYCFLINISIHIHKMVVFLLTCSKELSTIGVFFIKYLYS